MVFIPEFKIGIKNKHMNSSTYEFRKYEFMVSWIHFWIPWIHYFDSWLRYEIHTQKPQMLQASGLQSLLKSLHLKIFLTTTMMWRMIVTTGLQIPMMMLISDSIKLPHSVPQMELWIHWQLSSKSWKGWVAWQALIYLILSTTFRFRSSKRLSLWPSTKRCRFDIELIQFIYDFIYELWC